MYSLCLSTILKKDMKNQIFTFGVGINRQSDGIFMRSPFWPELSGIYLFDLDD